MIEVGWCESVPASRGSVVFPRPLVISSSPGRTRTTSFNQAPIAPGMHSIVVLFPDLCRLRGIMPYLLALVIFVCLMCDWTLLATSVDTNFSETIYADAGNLLTGIAWRPDGSDRLFASRQIG